jgi:hypothetical protein
VTSIQQDLQQNLTFDLEMEILEAPILKVV